MRLLDKLWDDTIGGPPPFKGVGKLRKLECPQSPRLLLQRTHSSSSDSPTFTGPVVAHSPMDEYAKQLLDRRLSAEFQQNQEEARRVTQSISIAKPVAFERTTSLPSSFSGSPGSTGLPSPSVRKEDNIWRSVFHPGSNKAGMDRVGSGKWDKADAKGPSVYDWMYHPNSKHNYR